jgi:hypothetical protein
MIIIQKGSKLVEGSVNELLSFNELHVSFEFEDDGQVLNFIKQHISQPTLTHLLFNL